MEKIANFVSKKLLKVAKNNAFVDERSSLIRPASVSLVHEPKIPQSLLPKKD